MQIVNCKLCQNQAWTDIGQVEFGLWQTTKQNLQRDTQTYPIAECQHCHHVQMKQAYDQHMFEKLYFHSAQEAVMWHESLLNSLSPYQQMVELFQPYVPEAPVIVDFGCGTGSLLKTIQQSALQPATLIGADFNDRCELEGVVYLRADLNELASLPTQHWPTGIDLAVASHVLEHIVDPLAFLQQIRQHLTATGLVFLEVPDFSQPLPFSSSGISNLVNLQHIHYFTLESISLFAEQAGYTVITSQQQLTGYIPRLQVLLQKSTRPTAVLTKTIKVSARAAVASNLENGKKKRELLAAAIINITDQGQPVGLWGVGADCYLLLREHPKLSKLCAGGQCQLFDFQLAGKHYLGQTVLSSVAIPEMAYPVFMTPLLAETRVKMHQVATNWQKPIIDLFAETDLAGVA